MANFTYKPENLLAGPFPVVTETGTAAEAIKKHMPITSAMKPVAKSESSTVADVIGIAAEDAEVGKEFIYYCTGEFFAESIVMPSDVTLDDIKQPCRKLNIYFR